MNDIGFFKDTVGSCGYAEAQVLLHLDRIENRVVPVAVQLALLIYQVADIVGCIQGLQRAAFHVGRNEA